MTADLSFLTGTGGASRAYTPDARKIADGTRSAATDRPIVELAPEGNHATTSNIAALQAAVVAALGPLATDQDLLAVTAKLELIRLLLANPALASGAAADTTLQAIKTQLAGVLTAVEQPFRPLPGTTKSVTAGPTATAAGALPLAAANAIPAGTATSYRVRNPAASASPITWILTTDATKTPVVPTPAGQAGTGGVAGDKTIDPGGVEIFSLSAAQQTALAAGTLYLSAVTPAGGSGVLSITPGFGG